MDCGPPGSSVHGDSPGNTGVSCHALLQGIFLTQGSNLRLTLTSPALASRFLTISDTWEGQAKCKETLGQNQTLGQKFAQDLRTKSGQDQKNPGLLVLASGLHPLEPLVSQEWLPSHCPWSEKASRVSVRVHTA